MISISEIKARTNGSNIIGEIRGLSTDTKPSVRIEDKQIMNGCIYVEIDTGKMYLYDAENKEWNEV